jgi:hypothetical protein
MICSFRQTGQGVFVGPWRIGVIGVSGGENDREGLLELGGENFELGYFT